MSALSKKLRAAEGQILSFWCPGCKETHSISHAPGRWTWNGNAESPTFAPSILVRSGHYAHAWKPGDSCWCTYNADPANVPCRFTCQQCHSFVTDGQIQFLSDCSHDLAGRTVDLPDWPNDPSHRTH